MTEETLGGPLVRNYFSSMIRLCKPQISLFSAFSAVSGFMLVDAPPATVLPALTCGVLLTASGAGALNHFEERRIDALMPRTAGRPLPAGNLEPSAALALSMVLIALGCGLLFATGKPAVALLGLFAIFWYNGFYTWLKARSRYAAIPGALIGAIPPAMGWLAAGGRILDPGLLALCFFFFMWQVPHFMLHILACGNEYEKAGLPALSETFTESQLRRLAFQWLCAAAASAQLVILFGLVHLPLTRAAVVAASAWLMIRSMILIAKRPKDYAGLFRLTNCYILLIMPAMTLDGVLRISLH